MHSKRGTAKFAESRERLRAKGFTIIDDISANAEIESCETFYLPSEYFTPYEAFKLLSTQWIVGVGGVVGLNYSAAIQILEKCYLIKDLNMLVAMEGINALETGALKSIRAK